MNDPGPTAETERAKQPNLEQHHLAIYLTSQLTHTTTLKF